jgi:hypothetical protein
MIWTTTGVASVAMATVKAKRQRLSMVISYLQQASFYVGNYTWDVKTQCREFIHGRYWATAAGYSGHSDLQTCTCA